MEEKVSMSYLSKIHILIIFTLLIGNLVFAQEKSNSLQSNFFNLNFEEYIHEPLEVLRYKLFKELDTTKITERSIGVGQFYCDDVGYTFLYDDSIFIRVYFFDTTFIPISYEFGPMYRYNILKDHKIREISIATRKSIQYTYGKYTTDGKSNFLIVEKKRKRYCDQKWIKKRSIKKMLEESIQKSKLPLTVELYKPKNILVFVNNPPNYRDSYKIKYSFTLFDNNYYPLVILNYDKYGNMIEKNILETESKLLDAFMKNYLPNSK